MRKGRLYVSGVLTYRKNNAYDGGITIESKKSVLFLVKKATGQNDAENDMHRFSSTVNYHWQYQQINQTAHWFDSMEAVTFPAGIGMPRDIGIIDICSV